MGIMHIIMTLWDLCFLSDVDICVQYLHLQRYFDNASDVIDTYIVHFMQADL